MNKIDVRILETSFRGYPRKAPCRWALHYNISFACTSSSSLEFLADEIRDVKGYFQLPQHFSVGLWGQFERVDVGSDKEIGLGPLRVWRAHGCVDVYRDQLWDAWARVKLVFDFRRFSSPAWFKANGAFRCVFFENLDKRWGRNRKPAQSTTFCYTGRLSSWSIESRLTGGPSALTVAGICAPRRQNFEPASKGCRQY